jgi:hypothetical protein
VTPLTATLLLALPPFLAAAAVGLLGHLALEGGARIAGSLSRRVGRRSVYISRAKGADVRVGERRLKLAWAELLPLAGGVTLALLWRHPFLSTWALAMSAVMVTVAYRTRSPRGAEVRAEAELFLTAFRSRYGVARSLAVALEGAAGDLEDEGSPLVRAAQESVRRLRASVPIEEALKPLGKQGGVLQRLATILARSGMASTAETRALLEDLEEQARRRRRQADRSQVTLSVVRITLRVLIAANVAGATASALIPSWRAHYAQAPLSYVFGTGMALAGWAYFAFKIKELEELVC